MRRRGWILGAAALGGLLLAGSETARAARLPDWAQAIAEAAPPIPEGVADDDYRVLLEERRIVVGSDGELRIRIRSARQALNSTADEIGLGGYPFGERAEVRRSKGWHLPAPDGKGARRRADRTSRTDEIDITLDDSFTSDARTRMISLSGIDRGSLVFFEFEAEERPYALAFSETFLLPAPLVLGRVEVKLPPGWSLRYQWLHLDGPAPIEDGALRVWEIRDLPTHPFEEMGLPVREQSPSLVVALCPPEGAVTVASYFADWAELSTWYEELIEGAHLPDEKIVAASSGAGGAHAPGSLERILAQATTVRDRVRYVAKEVGIGGYLPRSAAETLETLYGDCKDKSTLLRAMLAAEEVESYPVLVSLSWRESVASEIASLDAFDHLIVAVPLESVSPQEVESYPAILPDSPWGPLLFLDTTDELLSPGWLSSSLAGKRAVVVAGDRGGLVRLPAWEPRAHRVECSVEGERLEDGSFRFRRVDRRYGAPASQGRAEYRGSAIDRESSVLAGLKKDWLDASLSEYRVEAEAEDGAFVETIAWTSSSLLSSSRGEGLLVFAGARAELRNTSLQRRETPVAFSHPERYRYESSFEGLPSEIELPPDRDRSGEGWSLTRSFLREGGSLRGRLELTLEKTRYSPEEFRDLRKLYGALRSASETVVMLR